MWSKLKLNGKANEKKHTHIQTHRQRIHELLKYERMLLYWSYSNTRKKNCVQCAQHIASKFCLLILNDDNTRIFTSCTNWCKLFFSSLWVWKNSNNFWREKKWWKKFDLKNLFNAIKVILYLKRKRKKNGFFDSKGLSVKFSFTLYILFDLHFIIKETCNVWYMKARKFMQMDEKVFQIVCNSLHVLFLPGIFRIKKKKFQEKGDRL